MTRKNTNPNAPRPKLTAELVRKDYMVTDRPPEDDDKPLKVWQKDLTYDEAWKLKEGINGSRKSTTARVVKMDAAAKKPFAVAGNGHNGKKPVENTGWSDAQRQAALARAARDAAAAAAAAELPPDPEAERAVQAMLDANPAINFDGDGEPFAEVDRLALLAVTEGDAPEVPDDSDIDALIDEANAQDVFDKKSAH